jgi:hypothetical protein
MRENDAQGQTSSPSHPLASCSSPEESNSPEEEPEQRWQRKQKERLLRNEKIKLLIIGIGLLALLVSFLFFLYTGNFLPLFGTIVIVYPFCRWLAAYPDNEL